MLALIGSIKMTICFWKFYFFMCACSATYVGFMKKSAFLGEETPLIYQTNHSIMRQDSSNSKERETVFTVPFPLPSLSLSFIPPSSFSDTEQWQGWESEKRR